jgi:hypothetical protein
MNCFKSFIGGKLPATISASTVRGAEARKTICYFPWAFPFLMRTTLKTVTAAMLKQNIFIKKS